ncbi:MAG: hypothetical protein M1839_005957 [Geoglossum umbratile]|nr:MAG: hypothetical protein M1839_005957 [Geoglossum umbratile]
MPTGFYNYFKPLPETVRNREMHRVRIDVRQMDGTEGNRPKNHWFFCLMYKGGNVRCSMDKDNDKTWAKYFTAERGDGSGYLEMATYDSQGKSEHIVESWEAPCAKGSKVGDFVDFLLGTKKYIYNMQGGKGCRHAT